MAQERDPATDYTYQFIRGALPPEARRLLEIGCGDGSVAARLQQEGFAITALDSDEECVAAARRLGVDARKAVWSEAVDGPFDAVLFTRSLHHVEDLKGGISAALACLAPGGRLVVEDFDFGFIDEASLGWFAGLVRILVAAGVELRSSDFLASLAEGEVSPLAAWHAQHDHDLHSATTIESELRRAASAVAVEGAAYFFRYIARVVPERAALIKAIRADESELIRLGIIAPLGRRYVVQA